MRGSWPLAASNKLSRLRFAEKSPRKFISGALADENSSVPVILSTAPAGCKRRILSFTYPVFLFAQIFFSSGPFRFQIASKDMCSLVVRLAAIWKQAFLRGTQTVFIKEKWCSFKDSLRILGLHRACRARNNCRSGSRRRRKGRLRRTRRRRQEAQA